jgi:hypothetical protein
MKQQHWARIPIAGFQSLINDGISHKHKTLNIIGA